MKIMNCTSPLNIPYMANTCNPVFGAGYNDGDCFVSSLKSNGMVIANPDSSDVYHVDEDIDITKPQKFIFSSKLFFGLLKKSFSVDFDPEKRGELYDKHTKEPIDVFIVKTNDSREKDVDNFHFISKDLKKEYGIVRLTKDYATCSEELHRDYKKENIVGDRIIVLWLENEDKKNIGGVGKLADKVAVRYCLDNGIEPNIVSIAAEDSQIAHFKRGKRYFKPHMTSYEYDVLMKKYGTSDPNEVFENLIKKSEKSGESVDLTPFKNCNFAMYLPKELAEEYK